MNKNKSFSAIAKPNHETMLKLMNLLDNPQEDLKIIHVAGTNGKGSVCAYLQSILTSAGFKTGKYTSPHMLVEYERISIDGINISKEDFNFYMQKTIDCANTISKDENDYPTQFELWTATAFSYFQSQKCDYVVLETGLGGRRDATNIIKNPIISVITKIAADHTELLGNSLAEIANEKAGIIKKSIYGGQTVTVEQEKDVLDVIKSFAHKNDNEFYVVSPPQNSKFTDGCEEFEYRGIKKFKSRMMGTYQKENAAIAIECAMLLNISEEKIKSGIYNAKNIGRFEILSHSPTVIFDGAHNSNGMRELYLSLKRYFPDKNFNFIIAFMHDKDIKNAIKELNHDDFCKKSVFYTVEVKNNKRAMNSDELCRLIQNEGLNAVNAKSMDNALKCAIDNSSVTVVCGSLYLYNELVENYTLDK